MGSEDQEFCLRWNNHQSTLISVFDSLFQREMLVDVVLAAEGRSIKVHRLVLCACSQYFEDLLNQQVDKQTIVFLKDVRYNDLKALVDYMYKGEVNVAQDQLGAFLSTAEALRIKGLADKDDANKSKCSPPENLPLYQKSKHQTQQSSLVTKSQKNSSDGGKTVESSPEETSDSPVPAQELPHEEVIMRIADMGNTEIIEDMTIGEHFIAVTPKIEIDSYQANLVVDQFESTDQWPSKEAEEDWSNSQEGLSNSSPGNPVNDTELDSLNIPGPSGLKTKRPVLNSSLRGQNSEDYQQIDDLKHRRKAGKSSDKSYPCPPRKYKHTYSLTRHLRYECGNNPQFSCPVCQHKLYHRRYVEKHIRRKHPSYVLPFLTQ